MRIKNEIFKTNKFWTLSGYYPLVSTKLTKKVSIPIWPKELCNRFRSACLVRLKELIQRSPKENHENETRSATKLRRFLSMTDPRRRKIINESRSAENSRYGDRGKLSRRRISVGLKTIPNFFRRLLTRRFQIQFLCDDGCPNKRCDGARSRPETESVAAGALKLYCRQKSIKTHRRPFCYAICLFVDDLL